MFSNHGWNSSTENSRRSTSRRGGDNRRSSSSTTKRSPPKRTPCFLSARQRARRSSQREARRVSHLRARQLTRTPDNRKDSLTRAETTCPPVRGVVSRIRRRLTGLSSARIGGPRNRHARSSDTSANRFFNRNILGQDDYNCVRR